MIIPVLLISLAVITPLQNGYVSPYPALTKYDPGTGARVLLIHDYEPFQRLQIGDEVIYQGVYSVTAIILFDITTPPPNLYPAGKLILQTCVNNREKILLVILTRAPQREGWHPTSIEYHLSRDPLTLQIPTSSISAASYPASP